MTHKTFYIVFELRSDKTINDVVGGPFDSLQKAKACVNRNIGDSDLYIKDCVIYECKPHSRPIPPKETRFVRIYVSEVIAHTHIPPQAIEVTFVNRELRPIPQELEEELGDQLV